MKQIYTSILLSPIQFSKREVEKIEWLLNDIPEKYHPVELITNNWRYFLMNFQKFQKGDIGDLNVHWFIEKFNDITFMIREEMTSQTKPHSQTEKHM